MTKQLVEFQLEDGTPIVFETADELPAGGTQRVSRGGGADGAIERAEQSFNQVAKRIRPAAQMVLDALRELNSPKEIGLEFGLKFSAKAGVVVASADSEVNFKVTVKWVNSDG